MYTTYHIEYIDNDTVYLLYVHVHLSTSEVKSRSNTRTRTTYVLPVASLLRPTLAQG